MVFAYIKARSSNGRGDMDATRTILKFHARLHGSEVIALNGTDAYATFLIPISVSTFVPPRAPRK